MQAELLADQTRSTPKAPLFHYTGEAALRGILEHRRPWCFSHSQQSDDTEVRYSFEIALRVIRDEIARSNPAVKSILSGLDGILASNPMGETFDFYFFSLSSHRDHARQWSQYGDHRKGFAIGLAPTLFQPDRTSLVPPPNENVFVGQVVYGTPATATRHRRGVRKLAKIITRVQETNPRLVRGQNLQTWFDEMNKAFIAELLIWNCLTAKSERYWDEQETRYIIMGVCALFDGIRKRHNGRNYVETPLPLSGPRKHHRDHRWAGRTPGCRSVRDGFTEQIWLSAPDLGIPFRVLTHAVRRMSASDNPRSSSGHDPHKSSASYGEPARPSAGHTNAPFVSHFRGN